MAIPLQQAIAEQSSQDNSDKDIAGCVWVNRAQLRELIEAAKSVAKDGGRDLASGMKLAKLDAALKPFEGDT